jgi:DNA polymerase/3'-5' exonuclease PolX
MKNVEIVRIFREIAYLIQIAENDPNTIYKVRAYEKAADVIENLTVGLEKYILKMVFRVFAKYLRLVMLFH